MSINLNITLPAATLIRSHEGRPLNVDWASIPADVVAKIAEVGAKTILTNVWNGGGKDRPNSERLAAVEGKLRAWASGSFNIAERSTSETTLMRQQYVDERRAAGMSAKQVDSTIRDAVTQVFGKDSAATFERFLDAVAAIKHPTAGSERDAYRASVEAGLLDRAQKAEAARAKAASKLDVADLGL